MRFIFVDHAPILIHLHHHPSHDFCNTASHSYSHALESSDWPILPVLCVSVSIDYPPELARQLTRPQRYNPELQKRSLENRIGKQQDFDDFVTRLKEYSRSDKPSMTHPTPHFQLKLTNPFSLGSRRRSTAEALGSAAPEDHRRAARPGC